MRARWFSSFLILFLLPSIAIAQTVIYEQTALETADQGAFQYLGQQLADDFSPLVTAAVETVTWQGSYYSGDHPGPTESFTIQIFSDAGGLPAASPLFEVVMDISKTAVGSIQGEILYEYSAVLVSGPVLDIGSTYWFSSYSNDSGSNYAWAVSLDGSVDGAIRNSGGAWRVIEGSRDNHVFSLLAGEGITAAEPIPTLNPVIIFLLAALMALTGLIYRRRRQ